MHPAIAARILQPVVADLLNHLNERMNTMLPLYMSHKIVEAMRIDQILVVPGSDVVELTSVMSMATIPVKREWIEQKVPGDDIAEKLSKLVGGYFMKYPDGYTSWSPAKAFEDGYTALPADGDAMYALNAMKQGKKVARRGWNGVKAGLNMFVVVMPKLHLPPYNTQEPGPKVNDRTAKYIGQDTPLDSQPYFALHTGVEGANWQPGWTPSVMDCLANDWFIVE